MIELLRESFLHSVEQLFHIIFLFIFGLFDLLVEMVFVSEHGVPIAVGQFISFGLHVERFYLRFENFLPLERFLTFVFVLVSALLFLLFFFIALLCQDLIVRERILPLFGFWLQGKVIPVVILFSLVLEEFLVEHAFF